MRQRDYFSFTYKLLIMHLLLQEQENTDVKAMAETTISTAELNILSLTNETGITPINEIETGNFNNETQTNLTKTQPEIMLVNNTGNERSDPENLMESILNKTQTKSKEIPVLVSQDCNKTEWNQSNMQIRQQQSAVDVQETHKYKNNISNTQDVNTTDHHRNGLHKDGKTVSQDTVEEMESEQLQNTSVPIDSYQTIHKMSSNDRDQNDKGPETDYMSHTLSPLIERNDGTIPIRVILYNPHEHRHENGIVSQHEYIVLQTGNPAYHGHLEKTPIHGQETSDKDEKGLGTAEADKQTSRRKHKGKKNHGKPKTSTSGGIRNTTDSNEEERVEKVYHHHHKGWKKHNSKEATDSHEGETSTEISQDIRKHGSHQSSIKPSRNNTIYLHKGRHFHKPGQFHKKHKLIQIVVADNTNGTVSSELTMKNKQHKQPHVMAADARNETSEGVTIKSNNRKNSSTDTIKKDEAHRKRPAGKKTKYQQHRTSENEKLNGNGNTSTLNVSSAQQPLIPLSTVWHKAHIPIGEHTVDDDLNEIDHSREEQPTELKPTQGDTAKAENLTLCTTSNKNSTETSADEANGSKKNTHCSSIHTEGSVVVNDVRKPNAGHVIDEPTASSREDSSETQGENIIRHYSKLLKWIDYPL